MANPEGFLYNMAKENIMSEEDHRFKRTEDGNSEVQEDKLAEHEEKVREFKWDDDVEEEETEGKLLVVSEKEINECASILANHTMSHITSEYFGELDVTGMQFIIPVDLDIHILMRKRFEEEWDLESRLDMFQCVREHLVAKFTDSEQREELNAKIQEVLPSTHRKKFTSGLVSLEDDAMVIADASNTVSIEISVQFAANL